MLAPPRTRYTGKSYFQLITASLPDWNKSSIFRFAFSN
jgi:hypothetical protein